MKETKFRLTVNGAERSVTCEPDTPLLDVLRHDLGLVAQGPVAGAIGNAVANAVGVRVRDLPLTRERVARAIEES